MFTSSFAVYGVSHKGALIVMRKESRFTFACYGMRRASSKPGNTSPRVVANRYATAECGDRGWHKTHYGVAATTRGRSSSGYGPDNAAGKAYPVAW